MSLQYESKDLVQVVGTNGVLEIIGIGKRINVMRNDGLRGKVVTESYNLNDIDCLSVSMGNDDEYISYSMRLKNRASKVLWECEVDDYEEYIYISNLVCKRLNINFYGKIFSEHEIPCTFCKRKISPISKICIYCGKNI